GFDEPCIPRGSPADIKASSPSPHRQGPKLRRGWARKALLPRPAFDVSAAQVGRRLPEAPGLKCWEDGPPQKPSGASRLEFCSEFTKPDSLCIHLMGTPKNHRSPPA